MFVCLFVQARVFATDNRKDCAYYEIWPFSVNYESVMFYSTGPGVCLLNSIRILGGEKEGTERIM
jgi:hypothetical protein